MIMTIGWWILIWIVSSLPSDDLPSLQILSVDKLAHCAVYFVLGWLMNLWLGRKAVKASRRNLIFVLLLISALADEYHQSFIPGRSVSVFDFLANALGLGIAWLTGLAKRDQRQRS